MFWYVIQGMMQLKISVISQTSGQGSLKIVCLYLYSIRFVQLTVLGMGGKWLSFFLS